MISGTIVVIAWRLAFVLRGFKRRSRSLGEDSQLSGRCLHWGGVIVGVGDGNDRYRDWG